MIQLWNERTQNVSKKPPPDLSGGYFYAGVWHGRICVRPFHQTSALKFLGGKKLFKRFTDCHKWSDPWFRRLPVNYKLLWNYICDSCDNAGVWKIDFETASYFIGAQVDDLEALKYFDGRLHVLSPGHWLVKKFVGFQFGELSSDSPLHKSVLKMIEKHTLELPYPKPRARVQVKDKVKDKDVKEREKSQEKRERFEKPLPEEVFNYAASIGFKLNGQHFCDYYEARGWEFKRGQPMKSWKAVVRTWKQKQENDHGTDGNESPISYTAIARAKREAEKARKDSPGGTLPTGVRDMPDVSS